MNDETSINNQVSPMHATMRVRARAVDMLGRQQIAGIPSAIHELFKNSYDAFALNVEVDVYRKRQLLVLRDNGYGMTFEDFLGRWLVLGTESKVGQAEQVAPWLGEYGEIPRRVLGEKGIGRLAIAAIGSVVLVLTRAKRQDGLHDTVAALIHWGFFELPGVDLKQLTIPILRLAHDAVPDKVEMSTLVDQAMAQLMALQEFMPQRTQERMGAELALMRFSPKTFYESALREGPQLDGSGFGTHFLIRPYDPVLELDLEADGVYPDVRPSKLQTLLAGFSNTMFPDIEPPPIRAAFRDHRTGFEVEDVIGERSFFTADDYALSDHLIEGDFDEHGQFQGTVRIYNREPVSYTSSFAKRSDDPLTCGSFRIRFGYVQGIPHQSLLSSADFAYIDRKLKAFGGLYIFRDGIRVLPYGTIEYDFLRIEQRRNKAHKDWFFSFRRMFGAVLLTSDQNRALQDKAGREGFRENLAYRQFRDVLEQFLMALAKDFFRPDAPLGDEFRSIREQKDEEDKLLRKREQLNKSKKEAVVKALNDFFENIERGMPSKQATALHERTTSKLDVLLNVEDADAIGSELHRLETQFRRGMDDLRKLYRIPRARGIALSKSIEQEWVTYRRTFDELERSIFRPVELDVDSRVALILRQRGDALDRRRLFRDTLNSRREYVQKQVKNDEQLAKVGLQDADKEITSGIASSLRRFHQDIENVLSDFERTKMETLTEDQFVSLRSQLERRLETTAEREKSFLTHLREQLITLSDGVRDGLLPDDIAAALEGRNISLQDEVDESLYWAQVGMALGIVQHEFNVVARDVKRDIQRLKPWADTNPSLKELFRGLYNGFAHLEDYLRLFAPLDRRLYRHKMELSGNEIEDFIRRVFAERFARHRIGLTATSEFLQSNLFVFPSTLLPVVVNIVDNACYWLTKEITNERWIRLDSIPSGLVIENNGPGIELRASDRIFDFGFSTKHEGRGMGLSIARRALQRDGMNIELIDPGTDRHPKFQISIGDQTTTPSASKGNDRG